MRGVHVKTVAGRRYVYAYHGRSNGRPQYCYLGPDGSYEVVSGLKGAPIANLEAEGVGEVVSLLVSHVMRRVRTASLYGPRRRLAEMRRLVEEVEWAMKEVGELLEELRREVEFLEASIGGEDGAQQASA